MPATAFWQSLEGRGPALIDASGVVTYDQLARRIDRLAVRLASSEKRLAAVIANNDVPSIIAYLALLRAGHAVLLLSPGLPAFGNLLTAYHPDLVIGSEPLDEFRAEEIEGVSVQVARRPADELLHPELAVLLTTSGSTGSPKVVRLSHAAVAANAGQIAEGLRMDPGDRAVTTLSPAYSFGLSVINSHLACGGSLFLTNRPPLEREFWSELAAHDVTTLPGVPFTFDVVRRVGGLSLAPASLRKLLQAGGRMEPAMIRWTRDAVAGRADLFVMYGQTEATARIAILPPEELGENVGSVGHAVPGGSFDIDGDGQIIYRGSNVMMGYGDCRADLGGGDERGGVLETGDLGRLDDGGRLWITGRLKRIVKPFGLRINLDDLEAQLSGLGSLAITGDDKLITITIEGGDVDAIAAAARGLAVELKLPGSSVRVRRIEALPRGANGKIIYGEL